MWQELFPEPVDTVEFPRQGIEIYQNHFRCE